MLGDIRSGEVSDEGEKERKLKGKKHVRFELDEDELSAMGCMVIIYTSFFSLFCLVD